MSIQAGSPFEGLTEELTGLVRAEVTLALLHAVNERSAAALAAWAAAIAPEVYQPAGFTVAEAALLIAARPFADLDALTAVEGVGLDELGDLVYAAAAAEAAEPARVLVEEVYEVSALGEAALVAELSVPIPALPAAVRLEAVTAYIAIEGKPQTVEHRPVVRQRKLEDTWAEIELAQRSRLWYLGAAAALSARAQATGQMVLFPRLAGEFLDSPILTIDPDADQVEVPPVSTQATDHAFYAFPEIEGEQFMLRFGEPPKSIGDEDPGGVASEPSRAGAGSSPGELPAAAAAERRAPASASPGELPAAAAADLVWPDDFRFHAESGDVLLFGPSYPSEVEVRLGEGEIAWRRGGELVDADRSRDVADALQPALAALAETPVVVGEGGAEVHHLKVTATSRSPGSMYLGLEAEIDAVVDRFAGGAQRREFAFTRDRHVGEVALVLPGAGAPIEAVVELGGLLSNSVIKQVLGATDAPTGDDKIGVRVATGVTYSQRFEVAEAFELSAVDIRVAEVEADTRLVVEVSADDATATATAAFEDAIGRAPAWRSLRLDARLPLEPETTYELRVRTSRGRAVWLCGAGGARHFLRRHQGNGPPARVDDVSAPTPLIGELRLRADEPPDEPRLEVVLEPGAHRLPLRDVEVFDDGVFRARLDLTDALGQVEGTAATLRFEAPSEGTVTSSAPLLRYRLRVEMGA